MNKFLLRILCVDLDHVNICIHLFHMGLHRQLWYTNTPIIIYQHHLFALSCPQYGERWQPSVGWEADGSALSVHLAEGLPAQVSNTRGAPQCPGIHSDYRRRAAGTAHLKHLLSMFSFREFTVSLAIFKPSALNTVHALMLNFIPSHLLFFQNPLVTARASHSLILTSNFLFSHLISHSLPPCPRSGGECIGRVVHSPAEQPSPRAGADCAAGVGRGAALLSAA